MILPIPDELLDALVERLADRVAVRVAERLGASRSSPWMDRDEAIIYTRIPLDTFKKRVADGTIRAHTLEGGTKQYFHVAELDACLGYFARGGSVQPLRGQPNAA